MLFKNVTEIKLPCELDRLDVREATTDDLARLGANGNSSGTVFVVSDGVRDGYVIGGAVGAFEDDKDFFEPSALLK